jgi:hypothetical protein
LIISTIYILLVFYIIQKWDLFKSDSIKKQEFHLAFALKLIAAFCLYIIYTEYYRERHLADIFKFYDDSLILSESFFNNPIDFFKILLNLDFNKEYFENTYYINMNHWDTSYSSPLLNESRLMIRINAIVNIISFNNYCTNVTAFVFLGFIGFAMILKSINHLITNSRQKILFWTLILFPSILLWSSGILKEPLIILSIGMILWSIKKLSKFGESNLMPILMLSIGLLLMLKLKFYVFACFTPALAAYLISIRFKIRPVYVTVSTFILLLVSIVILNLFESNYNPVEIIAKKQNDFIRLATFYKAGSYFYLAPLSSDLLSFIQASPMGIVNGFFRPFPSNIHNITHVLPLIENIIIYVFFIYLILLNRKRIIEIPHDKSSLIISSLFFTLLLFTVLGMTTPVVGALVRYKLPATLFLIILSLLIYDHTKALKKR